MTEIPASVIAHMNADTPAGWSDNTWQEYRKILDKCPNLAIKLFTARNEADIIQDDVVDELFKIAGQDPDKVEKWFIHNVTFDFYDYSFEFKQVKQGWEPTPEMLEQFWKLGFDRCWICHGKKGENDYIESYYSSDRLQTAMKKLYGDKEPTVKSVVLNPDGTIEDSIKKQ